MNAQEGAELIALAKPQAVVPIHVEGWSHFSEQEAAAARVFDAAPASVRDRIRWLPLGEATEVG